MKTLNIKETTLEQCLRAAQREKVVIMRNNKPVAPVLGIRGMDLEQVELAESPKFWALIEERRAQKKITRQQLERLLAEADAK
jgi:hypothetical protein